MTEQEWMIRQDFQAMVAALRGKDSDRIWRLFAVACVRHAQHLLRDDRIRKALDVAERFADGESTRDDLLSARDQAEAAAYQAHHDAYIDEVRANFTLDAQYREMCAVMRDADDALLCAVDDIGSVFESPNPVIPDFFHYPDLLREIFGNPFRWKLVDPAWLTWNEGATCKIAQTIYVERNFDILPDLADALEEAGCNDGDILNHCRQPGGHVLGCWVLDLVLNKA